MHLIYLKYYDASVSFNYALGYAYDGLVHGSIPFDANQVWASLLERVNQGIYMGEGLLLPHTRVASLKEPLFAFAVCPNGFLNVKVPAKEIPQFMGVLLSPAESATAHTQFIAKIARKLLNANWKEKALASSTPEKLKALFED